MHILVPVLVSQALDDVGNNMVVANSLRTCHSAIVVVVGNKLLQAIQENMLRYLAY